MSSYQSSYSNSGNYSAASSSTPNSSYSIPSSQRPDGSYRDERRVRPGYSPDAESSRYVSPAYRKEYTSSPQNETTSGSNDRVDSWSDVDASSEKSADVEKKEEAATVIAPQTQTTQPQPQVKEEVKPAEIKVEESKPVETEANSNETLSWDNTEEGAKSTSQETETQEVQIARVPSQLASAIDGALDGLSLGTGSPSISSVDTSRPMGRYAAQIANDEREGRTYRRYDNNFNSNNNNNNNNNSYTPYNSAYNNYNNTYNRGYYNRDGYTNSNNPNTIANTAGATTTTGTGNNLNTAAGTTTARPTTWTRSGSNSDLTDNRFENEFKVFLEDLTGLRKEMAIINAKLEYIRYTKSRDHRELTTTELERIALEPGLINRINAIFDAIDGLNNKQ